MAVDPSEKCRAAAQDAVAAPPRRVIAIGASAGGVEALRVVCAGLPADLTAAVLVVLHGSPARTSLLPEILQRRCGLPVVRASDGDRLLAGRVYVAPSGRRLIVRPGDLQVSCPAPA